MIKVSQYVYRNVIDEKNPNNFIPMTIGLAKGDLIVFDAAGHPVRFSAGTASGKILETDPTSPTGWKLGDGGGGGGSASLTVSLKNNTGASILTGTVVVIDPEGNEREIKKASDDDIGTLFVTSADSAGTNDSVDCYCIPNTICNVLCTSDAVSVGDTLIVSSTDGIATSGDENVVGIALTAKASGSAGYVKCLLNCYQPVVKKTWTAGTTDLEDGVSTLQQDHFYYYYEDEGE